MAKDPERKDSLPEDLDTWLAGIREEAKAEVKAKAPEKQPAAGSRALQDPAAMEDFEKQRKHRRLLRKARRGIVLLGSVVAILAVAWGITSLVTAFGKNNSGGQPPVSLAAGSAASQPLPAAPDNTAWNFVGPVQQTINQMELLTPDFRMIALPENGRVDMSYFSTVTFVGDSLTQGFQIYSQGIPNAHYCAYKGIGPKQIYDGSIQRKVDGTQEIPMDALVASAPANVYILLGANAMVGLDDESILAYYREMLAAMRAALPPTTGYYIQSITPVRPDNDPGFDMARIDNLNNQLAKMAFQENLYFLDLTEILAGDDNYLREDFTGKDGYHLSPSGYAAWADYLVTHTAYNPANPYLEGSPFYKAPEPVPEPAPEPAPASVPASVPVDPAAVPPADPAATPPADPAAPVDPAATPPADPAAPVDPAAAPPVDPAATPAPA